MRKQFVVLGLGSFGRSVALTLENMGCDVIVVDKSRETIQEIADRVTYAITADITEKEALSTLGTRNLDGAIIGVAENLEAGIMATLLCKEIGIPMVVAKAKNKLQGTILKKVGADTVVQRFNQGLAHGYAAVILIVKIAGRITVKAFAFVN